MYEKEKPLTGTFLPIYAILIIEVVLMKQNYPDASRVWQRVHPSEPMEQRSLQMLLQQLNQDSAFLRQFLKSNDHPLLQEYNRQINCLKGILILTGGTPPRTSPAVPRDHVLSRCYDHALQRLSAYQLRSSDPVYGPVFRDLAHQTEHHCRLITELLGSTK